LQKITDTTIAYPKEKVKAGVNAVQILTLGAECCLQWIIKNSWKYINQIIEALADVTPVIVLEKDVGLFERNGKSRASALGVD
jgi:uroporphyrinogen decarboxylase